MKNSITNHQLLLIRECKRSKESTNILKRIVSRKCALPLAYVEKNHLAYCLLTIVLDYDLLTYNDFRLKEFILQDLNPKKWYTAEVKDYTDNLIEALISVIRNSDISNYPRYPRSAWFRNKYPDY